MYGWIIVNGFLYTSKFSELTDLFMEAAKEHKIDLLGKRTVNVSWECLN